ncbi:MAG: Sir2 silent information regulator family NAD-dependent deacetylase [Clostridia bacterium]|nr:Sir2 silent information regulator family NAD-dependent deacetylase [Clostridia bacterium]
MFSGKVVYENTENGLEKLRDVLSQADTVLIGAGAGLSTSAGFVYTGERLERYFGDFVRQYRFRDMYSGGFYPFDTPEEHWAYWSRYIFINRYMKPPKPVYEDLFKLVKDKDYFVITTNVDHCFQRAGFDRQRMFYTQGDYGLWQCSKPCHLANYDNAQTVRKMVESQGFIIEENDDLTVPQETALKMVVPTELVPRCPRCGRPMSMNLRSDDTFVEDEGWHAHARLYSEYLDEHSDSRTVFLDLGIGGNTPTIVKFPFMRMTQEWPDATYVCLNFGEAFTPVEIQDRSICINDDIGDVLKQLLQQ